MMPTGMLIKEDGDSKETFVHNKHLKQARQYNLCVEDCQKPLRDARFQIEFQLKEWQVNLNECFHFCKRDNSHPTDCIEYCLKEYKTILNDVEVRLN